MNSTQLNDIALEALASGLAEGSITLVDVREADEFAAGHIPGALFNPLSKFDPAALPTPTPGKKVVLYCRSGRRSVLAAEQAWNAGRTDVDTHFGGGMLAWIEAGFETQIGA